MESRKKKKQTVPGSEVRSRSLEIERKYRSEKSGWKSFVSLCKSKNPYAELEVGGPDTYYDNGNVVLRWRCSQDVSELTVKSRYSSSSSLIREEEEVYLKSDDNSARGVMRFLRKLGFRKLFRIHKHCHIFWFKDRSGGDISVVIYKVTCRGKKDMYFIEIEAEKGQSVALSKKLIGRWEKKLSLVPSRRVDKTLFEIYSGRRTRMVDHVSQKAGCAGCFRGSSEQACC